MKNNYNMISKKSQHKKLKFLTIVLIISTTFVCIHWILILPANATQTVGESLKKSSQRIVKETTEIKIQELLSSNSSIIPQIPLGDGKIYKFLSTEKLLLKDLKDFVFYKGKFENGHQIFQKFDRISSLEMTPNLRGSINSRSTIFLRKSFLYLGGIFVLTKSCYQTGKFIIYIYHSAINQTNKIRKLILDYLVSDPNLIKIKPIERYIQVEIHNSNEKNFTYFLKTLNLLIVINLIDSIFPNQRVKIVDSFPVNLNPKLCCKNSFLFRVRL